MFSAFPTIPRLTRAQYDSELSEMERALHAGPGEPMSPQYSPRPGTLTSSASSGSLAGEYAAFSPSQSSPGPGSPMTEGAGSPGTQTMSPSQDFGAEEEEEVDVCV